MAKEKERTLWLSLFASLCSNGDLFVILPALDLQVAL